MKSGLSNVSTRPTKMTRFNSLPFVSHQVNLLFALSLDSSIPFPGAALSVLVAQHDMRDDATSEEEQCKIRQNHAVPKPVERLVCCTVDIAGDNAVEIAPSNDKAKCDTTLIHAFGVVRAP
jgi:hypothetical protein